MKQPSVLLSPGLKKIKQFTTKKFFIFQGIEPRLKKFFKLQEIKLFSLLRNFLHILKRKIFLQFEKWNFLIFQETETPRRFLIYQVTELSYISEKGNPEFFFSFRKRNFLIFHEVTFRARKIFKKFQKVFKKSFIFREAELSSPKLKKLFIFQHGNYFS